MPRVLLCGGLIVTLSLGVRHGFGLWLAPVTMAHEWSRGDFSFAIALQNLMWGLSGPLVGMAADRWGARPILLLGALLYALGLSIMARAGSPTQFDLGAGLVLGLSLAATTYSVVYGVIGRHVPIDRRSWAMGVTAAAGSFGQFLMLPVENWLITHLGWQKALWALAAIVMLIVPVALGLREGRPLPRARHDTQGVAAAAREAVATPSFNLLMLGYFVCGFQVVFIGVHLPGFLRDRGFSPQVATNALALIGLFNVLGTYLAGALGQRMGKRHILAGIYVLRSVAIAAFLLTPMNAFSVYAFAAVIGFLWLSTVPTTNAIVAQIFGVQHLSMLSGLVFFSHQIGSFLGVWLGGKLYDANGNYNLVWWIAIALGLLAAAVNLQVNESPLVRTAPVAA